MALQRLSSYYVFLFVHTMLSEIIKIKQHRLTQAIPLSTVKKWTGWFVG